MTSERRGAEGASNSSSFTGTKAGAIVSGDPAAPSFSFVAPRRRSRQPSRERRIHLKMRLAFSPCRRATAATETPEARASSTIRLRSSRLLVVRRRSPVSSFAAIGVHLGSRWTPNPIQMRADRRPSDHAYGNSLINLADTSENFRGREGGNLGRLFGRDCVHLRWCVSHVGNGDVELVPLHRGYDSWIGVG